MPLKPFFNYYGSKYRSSSYHPRPYHDLIIEPFAGSACYSLFHHYNKQVMLNDLSEVVCGIWNYIINVSEEEFLRLPDLVFNTEEIKGPQEAKWLIGSWLAIGRAKPVEKPTSIQSGKFSNHKDGTVWNKRKKYLLAAQLQHVRHWTISQKNYTECPDIEGCWFIDPPYHKASRPYMTPKFTEYEQLGRWSTQRKGMVIVCENEGAEWLPFRFLKQITGMNGLTREVVYYQKSSRLLYDV